MLDLDCVRFYWISLATKNTLWISLDSLLKKVFDITSICSETCFDSSHFGLDLFDFIVPDVPNNFAEMTLPV